MQNKNYLTIFSREGLNNYLHDCLPRSNELLSEKNVTFQNLFSFEVLDPNTLLNAEGERETENCYAVVAGTVKVFKHDSRSSQTTSVIDKRLKVTDLVTQGAFGRHIATLDFNDLKTIDDKIFLGLESHHENQVCQFTFITGPNTPVVAFKLNTGSTDF